MTDDDLEHNRTMLERGEKILDTKKLRPENVAEEKITSNDKQNAVVSRKSEEGSKEAVDGFKRDSRENDRDHRFQLPHQHATNTYPPKPLFFPVHKYFGY